MIKFGTRYGEYDPLIFWSKVDYSLIMLSLLSFYNIGFLAVLISGFLDLYMISFLKKSFTKYNIKARYNVVESVGKQLVFMSSYSFLLGVTLYFFVENYGRNFITGVLLSIIAIFVIGHIYARTSLNKEIIDSTMHWKLNYEESIFKDYFHMEKYIHDQHDGLGPVFAIRNEIYEIENGIIKYKGKEYLEHMVYQYLMKNDRKIEDLTDKELLEYIKK